MSRAPPAIQSRFATACAAIYRNGDAVVAFDSSARLVAGNVADTLGALRPTIRRGNLSAALIAALRAGSSLRDRADSLELVIVSPFAREEFDAATDTVRKLWPGKARLVRVASPATDTAAGASSLTISAAPDDPLTVTVALARTTATASGLIDRGAIPSERRGMSSEEAAAASRPQGRAVQRAARRACRRELPKGTSHAARTRHESNGPPSLAQGSQLNAP